MTKIETGNYYYGARYYDPKISVWLSVDPMSSERSWLTPYNFVQNNPIMREDPSGMLDGWVKGEDGLISWDAEVNSQQDLVDQGKSGEFLGQHGYGALDGESGLRDYYGSDGNVYQVAEYLPEVVVDGGKMSEHAKTMSNPIVQKIHKGQLDFVFGTVELTAHLGGKVGEGLTYLGYGAAFIPGAQAVAGGLITVGSGISTGSSLLKAGLSANNGDARGAMVHGSSALLSITPGLSRLATTQQGKNLLRGSGNMKINLIEKDLTE